jgi:hypothetical protein
LHLFQSSEWGIQGPYQHMVVIELPCLTSFFVAKDSAESFCSYILHLTRFQLAFVRFLHLPLCMMLRHRKWWEVLMYSHVVLVTPSGMYLISGRFFNIKPILISPNYISIYYGKNYNHNHNSKPRMTVFVRTSSNLPDPTLPDPAESVLSCIVSSHYLATTGDDRITNKKLIYAVVVVICRV